MLSLVGLLLQESEFICTTVDWHAHLINGMTFVVPGELLPQLVLDAPVVQANLLGIQQDDVERKQNDGQVILQFAAPGAAVAADAGQPLVNLEPPRPIPNDDDFFAKLSNHGGLTEDRSKIHMVFILWHLTHVVIESRDAFLSFYLSFFFFFLFLV